MHDSPEPTPAPRPGRAMLWIASALPLPGAAHLRAGWRRSGLAILGGYLLLIAGGVVLALTVEAGQAARVAVQPRWLLTAAIAVTVVAALWIAVIAHSYVLWRPRGARTGTRILSVAVAAALCIAVAAPASAALQRAYLAHSLLTSMFGEDPEASAGGDGENPWGDRERINLLLLGSDNADNRYGVRTDTMIVASVSVTTGDAVLIGLPRNLENIPFPEGTALAEQFPEPYGYNDILTELYQFVAEDPETWAINPDVGDPAANTLRQTIDHAIGLDIDYYALVDMFGFRDLIDAIGGVRIRIEEPIYWGQRGDVLEPGMQTLSGTQSMWYVRSRINSDDYTRMGRQGCLIQAVAEQADPVTVASSFREVAAAADRTLATDIPLDHVDDFIDLAEMVPQAEMSTLQLSPPQVTTGDPDWERVRELVDEAIAEQSVDDSAGGSADSEQDPSPSAEPSQEPTGDGATADDGGGAEGDAGEGGDEEGEWWENTPGRQVGEEPESLDSVCP